MTDNIARALALQVQHSIEDIKDNVLTDEQAVAIAANTAARHTHDNKTVLDDITSEKIAEWDGKQPAGDYLTSETDPTVPKWAKQPNKPTYTAAEVGALPSNTKIPSKTSELENDKKYAAESQLLSASYEDGILKLSKGVSA